jgi:hypothetical protein
VKWWWKYIYYYYYYYYYYYSYYHNHLVLYIWIPLKIWESALIQNFIFTHMFTTYLRKFTNCGSYMYFPSSTTDNLLMLFFILFRCRLQYAHVEWNTLTSTDMDKLERI